MRSWKLGLLLLGVTSPAMAQTVPAERMAFWNLTSSPITQLRLSPAGTDAFGPNQCVNDRDGSVDHDERLRLTGVTPGRYDVKLTSKRGQSCLVRDVELKSGGKYSFSLSDSDLTDCH